MYESLRLQIQTLSAGRCRLLAVSKLQPAAAVRALYARGQRAFGENYVQEALLKQQALADLPGLEWHLIGPLQSNKAALAAQHFDWVQSLDRLKLVPLLGAARPDGLAPLNVLIQVNVDGQAGKAGCSPQLLPDLVVAIRAQPRLRLRGLMAIPAPDPDMTVRAGAFRALAGLFHPLAQHHPDMDTLSMGMSADYPLAIECGATLVRLGTALFGPR